jgi:hypothetical protein
LCVRRDHLAFDKNERGPDDDLLLRFGAVRCLGTLVKSLGREVLDAVITHCDHGQLFSEEIAEEVSA